MAALSAFRPTQQYGGEGSSPVPYRWYMPVAAATTIYQGALVTVNSSGYAVPSAAATAGSVLGRSDTLAINTTANGFGAAGALSVEVRNGAFLWDTNGAFTIANFGAKCWAFDDHTVTMSTEDAAAGMFMGLDSSTSLDGSSPQAIVLTIGVGFFGTLS